MSQRQSRRAAWMALLGALFGAAPVWAQTVTTFSVPGAVHTRAFGISPSGAIVGIYVPAGPGFRGFHRGPEGLTLIDYPGALATAPIKVNPRGDVVGWYTNTGVAPLHGFLLRDGEYSTLDVPGATSTQPFGINARGDVVGAYQNADGVFHAFVLRKGVLTSFDAPGANLTQAVDINSNGDIVVRGYASVRIQ